MTRPPDAAERPVRTLFLGSGRFAQPTLGRLAAHPSLDLVAVVTAPPRPIGRHRLDAPTPVEAQAQELGLHVLAPDRLRDSSVIDELLDLEPDLVVLADYGQIVPPELLDRRFGALNLHPSLLPRHRGATPIPAAILAGDAETGVTLFRMDAGIDTGPVVAVEHAILDGDETTPALQARLAIAASGILSRALDPWLDGEIEAVPQGDAGATRTRPLLRDDGRLDPTRPAWQLERQVRAFLPWPGTFVETGNQRLVILGASVTPADDDDEVGLLVPDPDGLALATFDGRLVLHEVQPAGGRPMSGEAYLRGRPSVLGQPVSRVVRARQPPVFESIGPATESA